MASKPITADYAKFVHRAIEQRAIRDLVPAKRNARTHSKRQIRQIVESIRTFGFINPVLVDGSGRIVAGHGRVEAARHLGHETVPVLAISHLSESELRAFAIADNRLAELAGWDEELLALELAELVTIDTSFDISVTGFAHAEVDLAIQGQEMSSDPADAVPEVPDPADVISRAGDLWILGDHRILCSDSRDRAAVRSLMGSETARVVFTDPPYNVPIDGHVSGRGSGHREFSCASGEMSGSEFTAFLEQVLANLAAVSCDGALHYVCMDWRHLGELTVAGDRVYSELKNLCVWNKTNGGMGSMYRSKHELVFVFKCGRAAHVNNVELGRFGRYRSNVWDYPGVNTWRKGRARDLADHPTVKPLLLVADAIQDASNRGDIVLDGFGGAGTTLIAAERTGRRARLVEIDPGYVDVAIRRWQELTGQIATHADTGLAFSNCVERAEPRKRRTGT